MSKSAPRMGARGEVGLWVGCTIGGPRCPPAIAPLGRAVDGEHRDREGDPGSPLLATQRGPRLSRPVRMGGRAPPPPGSASRAPTALRGAARRPGDRAVYNPLPNHLHARVDDRGGARRQARAVREAGRHDGRRGPGHARCRREGRPPQRGLHVPPAPAVDRVRELIASGRIGTLQRSTAASRTSTTTRKTSATTRTSAAARSTTSAATR